MSVMKVLEIMAESEKSWEDATAKAVAKASETVKDIRSAYVQEQSVTVMDNKLHKYRINLKITFEVR
ncbi:MAG: dodecin domain-containing protein [Lewinellaceae bacterium]|nr:dodecin domain-containing protein [Phaeodactylibacter sp.]MCB0612218.1 dodecin domain-containing protein [Phaeodactylibacter sp.]MCB9347670.1 dodecin domain-containing protein [Lewinellaceae bacterium]